MDPDQPSEETWDMSPDDIVSDQDPDHKVDVSVDPVVLFDQDALDTFKVDT